MKYTVTVDVMADTSLFSNDREVEDAIDKAIDKQEGLIVTHIHIYPGKEE